MVCQLNHVDVLLTEGCSRTRLTGSRTVLQAHIGLGQIDILCHCLLRDRYSLSLLTNLLLYRPRNNSKIAKSKAEFIRFSHFV